VYVALHRWYQLAVQGHVGLTATAVCFGGFDNVEVGFEMVASRQSRHDGQDWG
jgi:hypothetical protein